ncbi:MAG TPA: methyltransferase domain-containing protein [Thermoplasmata archaeon]|nr:methyltransferase domain-containing protein [Thermoplasmata archaeon]
MNVLPPILEDRRCFPRALDNPLRRWLSPPSRELDLVGIEPGQHVIDLGAGIGYYDPEILDRLGPSGRLTIVDIDPENLELARQRIHDDRRASLHVGSGADLGFLGDASVDRALLLFVLCCLAEKERTLDEVWRVLRPGGRLFAVYPRIPKLWIRRKRGLAVRRERWRAIQARRPWLDRPVRPGRVVIRHLLEKPL